MSLAVLAISVAWTTVTIATSGAFPSLEDTRPTSRRFAYAGLQLQTFRFHIGAIASVAATVAFAIAWRRWRRPTNDGACRRSPTISLRLALMFAVAGAVGVGPELRHAWPASGDEPSVGTPVRVMSLNDERLTTNAAAIVRAIDAERPDLIAFEQFAAEADDAIARAVGGRYSHRLSFPSPPFQGIALYSRWPARVTRAPDFHAADHGRILEAEVDVAGRTVRVCVVHLTSPRSVARLASNRVEVATLIRLLAGSSVPTLVVGDFNASFGSQTVDAMRSSGLRHVDDVAGRGLRWTWQPFGGLPIARIDHAFVSPQWGVVDSRVLGDVGSDHRPICDDLRLR